MEQPQSKSKGGKAQESGRPKASGRAKGQGAKSKANRREPGASDEETGDLTKQQAAAADVKVPDPADDRIEWSDESMTVVVEYICDQEVKKKWKTRKSEVFTHVSLADTALVSWSIGLYRSPPFRKDQPKIGQKQSIRRASSKPLEPHLG